MNNSRRHILICGRKRSGKTTMVSNLMKIIDRPIAGFRTAILTRDEEGIGGVYMFPADAEPAVSPSGYVGDVRRKVLNVNYDVFDKLGVELIQAPSTGVIIMDEIGYMEIGSDRFCSEVIEAFDRNIPILATIKSVDMDYEYLNMLRNHPNVNLLMLTEENREEVYARAEAIVRKWNEEVAE